jgi:LmbE family N-acetylglucosaminyl deacetylase
MLRIRDGFSALRNVLCIGAHCDDIEIGCGGALFDLSRDYPHLKFDWLVLSGDEQREAETRKAAAMLIGDSLRVTIDVARFRTSHFPYVGGMIKDYLEERKSQLQPDLIFTHRLDDRHQDHRIAAELTWNSFRDHQILEYEIPKYEGDLTPPNYFFPLSIQASSHKVNCLMNCFATQRTRPWFRPEVFDGLMRLRGVECKAVSGCAEAFHARKLVA